jgi:DNA repair photolyase
MEIKEIAAKSVLTPSKLPGVDFVINPYIGCGFACTYCYATFMARYVGKTAGDWGKFVFVKVNAPEILKEDLAKLKDKGAGKSILLSSVTDPYQGAESKYKITQKCLQVLADFGFSGQVEILTKSNLVLRDAPLFKKLKDLEVGFKITTTDDAISRYFEKYAPAASLRIEALKKLNEQGIKTYVFIGPLLPHFVAEEEKLEKLFKEISETGNKELFVEHINLSKYILERLERETKDLDKNVISKFYESKQKAYREKLDEIVAKLVKKYNLKLRSGSTIYHKDF